MEPNQRSAAAYSTPAQQNLTNLSGHQGAHKPKPGNVAEKHVNYQIVRMPRLCKRLDVGKTTVYDWLNPKSPRHDPTFPVPIKLSVGGAIGWIESEVDAWLASRVRAKYNS